MQSDSPASTAGLKAGDMITSVNDQAIDGPRELARRIAAIGPDKDVRITYLRDGASKTATLHLGKLPAEQQDARGSNEPTDGTRIRRWPASASNLRRPPSVPGAGRDGVVVADIDPDGVAAQKGLKAGDVILDVGGQCREPAGRGDERHRRGAQGRPQGGSDAREERRRHPLRRHRHEPRLLNAIRAGTRGSRTAGPRGLPFSHVISQGSAICRTCAFS